MNSLIKKIGILFLLFIMLATFVSSLFAVNIFRAINDGDYPLLRYILKKNSKSVRSIGKNKHTPIIWAFYKKNIDIANLLVHYCVSAQEGQGRNEDMINKANDFNQTPLYFACYNNSIELFRLLLPYLDRDVVNKVSTKGITPFWFACCKNNIFIFKKLLPYCNKETIDNPKCIEFAIKKHKNINMIKALLINGIPVSKKLFIKKDSKLTRRINSYIQAVIDYDDAKNKKAFLKEILKKSKCKEIYNLLIRRSFAMSARLVSENSKLFYTTPFFRFLDSKKLDFKKVFKYMPVVFLHAQDKNKETLLSLLVKNSLDDKKFLEFVKLLLPLCRKSVNIPNRYGRTPFSIACIRNDLQVCKILMPYCDQATINLGDHRGNTPLKYALKKSNRAIVRLLLENGATLASVKKEIALVKDKQIEKYIKAVQTYNMYKNKPCAVLIHKDDAQLFNLLIRRCFTLSMKMVLSKETTFGRTPFFLLCETIGSGSSLSNLFSILNVAFESATISILNEYDVLGRTPFTILLWNNFLYKSLRSFIEQLLPKFTKETILRINKEGHTALSLACYLGNEKIVKHLLKSGAKESVNQPDIYGYTPLHWVCNFNHTDVANLILPLCSESILKKRSYKGVTPVLLASEGQYFGQNQKIGLLFQEYY